MTQLVLATHNRHKVVELRRILADAGLGDVEVLSADDLPGLPDVAETGTTFAENALLKAHAVAAATGLPAVADDSGLCVAVLGRAPRVFSARWSGRHGDDDANTALLLGQIADVPDERRGAAFVCAAALVTPEGTEQGDQRAREPVQQRWGQGELVAVVADGDRRHLPGPYVPLARSLLRANRPVTTLNCSIWLGCLCGAATFACSSR